MSRLAILHPTARQEEKLILDAAKERGIPVKLIDIHMEIFNPETYKVDYDIALERSVSTVKGKNVVAFLESLSVAVVNSLKVAQNCGDKFVTSILLTKVRIPIARFALVFCLEQACRLSKSSEAFLCPEPKILQATNFCGVGFRKEKRSNRSVLLGAIDNLVKGTAGNVVQCMNLMYGFPETMGLEFPGLHPV